MQMFIQIVHENYTFCQCWLLTNNLEQCANYQEFIYFINPLNPIVHFWLHHTAHCAEKIVSARLRAGSASAERVGGV